MMASSGQAMKLWKNPNCWEILPNLNKCTNFNLVELNWNLPYQRYQATVSSNC